MHVEPVRPVSKEAMVRPRRTFQHRPIEPETHDADLTAVRVAREGEIGLALRHVPESAGVVEQQQTHETFSARMVRENRLDVLPPAPPAVVGTHDLDRARWRLDDGFFVHQEPNARSAKPGAHFFRRLVIMISEHREAPTVERGERREGFGERPRRPHALHGEEVAGEKNEIRIHRDESLDAAPELPDGLPRPQMGVGDLNDVQRTVRQGCGCTTPIPLDRHPRELLRALFVEREPHHFVDQPHRGDDRKEDDQDRQEIEPAKKGDHGRRADQVEPESDRRQGEQPYATERAEGDERHAGYADENTKGRPTKARPHEGDEMARRCDDPAEKRRGDPRRSVGEKSRQAPFQDDGPWQRNRQQHEAEGCIRTAPYAPGIERHASERGEGHHPQDRFEGDHEPHQAHGQRLAQEGVSMQGFWTMGTSYEFETLRVERIREILRVVIAHPSSPMNAVDGVLHRELALLFRELKREDEARAILLTGEGKAFSAGGDFNWFPELQKPEVLEEVRRDGKQLIWDLLEVELPIIAAVNGPAVGLGASLALLSDVIFASEKAVFADPHVRVGIVAGDGGAAIWPLLLGPARAKQYLMTGDAIPAREAERIGLINFVSSPEKLDEEATAFAERLAAGAPLAVRYTKLAVNKLIKDAVNTAFDASTALEIVTFKTDDHMEALRALQEKREPRFRGR